MVDRMVKAGLLEGVRDRAERRTVRLAITGKREDAPKPGTLAGWKSIQKILSPLSHKDQHSLARLLERMTYKTLKYLNSRADMEEMTKKWDGATCELNGTAGPVHIDPQLRKPNVRAVRRERLCNRES
jgi:hypothetical protein